MLWRNDTVDRRSFFLAYFLYSLTFLAKTANDIFANRYGEMVSRNERCDKLYDPQRSKEGPARFDKILFSTKEECLEQLEAAA